MKKTAEQNCRVRQQPRAPVPMECSEALEGGVAPGLSLLKPIAVPVAFHGPVASAPPAQPAASLAFDGPAQILVELRTMLEEERGGRYAVKPDYTKTTQEGQMEAEWRAQLVRWMQEVAAEFKYSASTAAAAVQLLDRFLSASKVDHTELQLLALVAVFIASKLHESKPVQMADIAHLFHAICTVHDVRRAELVVGSGLKWSICTVTAVDFVGHITALITDAALAEAVRAKAVEISMISLDVMELLAFPPSQVALCAVACAFQLVGVSPREFFVWLASCRLGVAVDETVVFRLFSLYFAAHPEDPRCGSPIAPTQVLDVEPRFSASAGAGEAALDSSESMVELPTPACAL